MLQKKSSLTLSAAVITVLASSSYATLATDLPPPEKKRPSAGDSWMKNRQKTASEEAYEKQKAERDAELQAIRQAKQETEVTSAATEKKPAEAPELAPSPKKETSSPAPVPAEKPASKPRLTLHEQIQINRQKKAEELLKRQQMNKGKAEAEPATQAETLHKNRIAMSPSQRRLMEKLGIHEEEKSAPKPADASTGMIEKEKPAASEEAKAGIPIPPPLSSSSREPTMSPTPHKTEPAPAQKPAAPEEAKAGIPTPPPPLPSGGEPKTPHKNTIAMSPSQRKLMDKLGIREEEKPTVPEETKAGIPIPPPAPAATGTEEKPTPSRSSLLEEIRKGKPLKHVDAPQR